MKGTFRINDCFLLEFSKNAAHISNRANGSASQKQISLKIFLVIPPTPYQTPGFCPCPAFWCGFPQQAVDMQQQLRAEPRTPHELATTCTCGFPLGSVATLPLHGTRLVQLGCGKPITWLLVIVTKCVEEQNVFWQYDCCQNLKTVPEGGKICPRRVQINDDRFQQDTK